MVFIFKFNCLLMVKIINRQIALNIEGTRPVKKRKNTTDRQTIK